MRQILGSIFMQKIRNIAIIAHVDHGKTTLVDKILHSCAIFRDNEQTGELILDNNDLERERGITIVSKNVSVMYKDVKINIIDTPGHADFGGEVERVLKMADGVLLLCDAFEGAMPQTRFVTQKALALGLKPIVVVNKVDKENCRPEEVYEQIFELFFNLEATEDQLDFPVIYGSSKQGWMSTDWKKPTTDIFPLMDAILANIPPAPIAEGTLQMQITSLDYSSFVGRIAIGRVARGTIKENQPVSLVKRDGTIQKSRIKELYTFEGLGKVRATEDQLDFPVIYGSSKQGWMSTDWKKPTTDIFPLMDAILANIPPAPIAEGTLQMQITSLDYSSFVGRIAIGRVARGTIKENMPVSLVKRDGTIQKSRIKELYTFEGLGKVKATEVSSGDICAVVGIEGFDIGDTIADFDKPEQLEVIHIDEPTMNMLFTINTSPFFGKE
ncbi:MAG: GTP-binding protein, partial [Mucilaginibacter sp.]|nr:GTP-binding protein [Mucilaginibacter sp.]